MRVKLSPGNKEKRFKRLDRQDWVTMQIKKDHLTLRSRDGRVSLFLLNKVYPSIKSNFNYEFIKRLIEDAN